MTTTATLATMTGTLSPPASSSAVVVGERVFSLKNVGETVITKSVGVVGARVPTIGDSVVGVFVGVVTGEAVVVFAARVLA